MSFWWMWGTKEDVLVEEGSREWGMQNLESDKGQLDIGEIGSVEVDVEE